jgi:DNA-binding response OmpR family regulator
MRGFVIMPGMDGIAMVKHPRADPLNHGRAILMLISETSVEKEAQPFGVGADDYIL